MNKITIVTTYSELEPSNETEKMCVQLLGPVIERGFAVLKDGDELFALEPTWNGVTMEECMIKLLTELGYELEFV
jgi:hypothetical protein